LRAVICDRGQRNPGGGAGGGGQGEGDAERSEHQTAGGLCSWNNAGRYFQCNIGTPKGLLTGTRHTITDSVLVGTGFVTAPAVGSAVNPETIYFN